MPYARRCRAGGCRLTQCGRPGWRSCALALGTSVCSALQTEITLGQPILSNCSAVNDELTSVIEHD